MAAHESDDHEYRLEPVSSPQEIGAQARCPGCHANLPRAAILCVNCGYHFASNETLVNQSKGLGALPDEGPTLEQQTADRYVRIFGWSWLGLPGLLILSLVLRLAGFGSFHILFDPLGLALSGVIGCLGFVIARNGTSVGPESRSIRFTGVTYAAFGLSAGVFAVGLLVASAFVDMNIGIWLAPLAIAVGSGGVLVLAAGIAVIAMGQRISECSL